MKIKNINDFKSKIKVGTQLKTTRTKLLQNDIIEEEILLRSVHKVVKDGFSLATLKDNKIIDAYVFYPKETMEIINETIVRINSQHNNHKIIFDIEIID